MALENYIVKIECNDTELAELAFSVETFDEYAASVEHGRNSIFTLKSWQEYAKAVEEAIKKLELKVE